jgi:hypothetical protein
MRNAVLALALAACAPAPQADLPPLAERVADPGRVTARRLNRSEYDNTVRDLLSTALRPSASFPPDDTAHGWGHMADALSLSPLHLELYEQAADALIEAELTNPVVPPRAWAFHGTDEGLVATGGAAFSDFFMLWTNGSLTTVVHVPHAGRYRLAARLGATQGGPDLARAALLVGGRRVREVEVSGEQVFADHAVEVELAAGPTTIGVSFLNDFWDPDAGEDRNLLIESFRLDGPFGLVGEPTEARRRFYPCDPEDGPACRAEIVRGFAAQAWRRPPDPEGLALLTRVTEGAIAREATAEQAVHAGIKAALLSPRFVFRLEPDPDPASPTARPLDGYELASRLSYFLWRSMPDDRLFALAADGALTNPDTLEAEARRMLADPKARALVDDLAGQWLYLRAVDDIEPDYATFPTFDDDLRASMRRELDLFVEDILLGDRSMLDLLTEERTFVDARLAAHYGVRAPDSGFGPAFMPDQGRVGLLGKAGLLAALSFPTRTSPVKRGQWVMAHLLCEAPPPAPAEVEGLPDAEGPPLSLRERMERHRQDPACATCHRVMDPIGFSLERFDAIGAFRTRDVDGTEIDPSGTWPGGPHFADGADLSFALAEDPRVASCMVRNVFAYALGRPPGVPDIPYLDAIAADAAAADHRFAALAAAIVRSEPFRFKRGEPQEAR